MKKTTTTKTKTATWKKKGLTLNPRGVAVFVSPATHTLIKKNTRKNGYRTMGDYVAAALKTKRN